MKEIERDHLKGQLRLPIYKVVILMSITVIHIIHIIIMMIIIAHAHAIVTHIWTL